MKDIKHYWLVLFAMIVTAPGCRTFYKTLSPGITNVEHRTFLIDSLIKENRYFILRSGHKAYYMSRPQLIDNNTKLASKLEELPSNHLLHLRLNSNRKMIYDKNTDALLLKEVHFYIPADYSITSGDYTLNLEIVDKMEVLVKDKTKSTSRYFLTVIGIVAGAVIIYYVILISAII